MAVQVQVAVPGLGQLRQLVAQMRQLGPAGGAGGGPSGGGGGTARRPRAPASLEQRLLTLIRSTRIGAGGASPLVGRSLDVVAPGLPPKAQLAIAAALAGFAAAAAAVRLFKDAVMSAASSLSEASRARTLSGGSAGQVAGLQALGIGAGDIAGLAASLRANLAGGGIAGATGARLGLGPTPGRRFGGANEATGLQQAIEAIAGLSTAEQRLVAARNLELDSILPQIEAFRRNAAAIRQDAAARSAIADPATLKAADDFQQSLERLKFNFMSLVQAFGKPFLQDATAAINVFASALRDMAAFLNANPQLMQTFVDGMRQAVNVLIGVLAAMGGKNPLTAIDQFNKAIDAEKARMDAVAANTVAQQANTSAMYTLAGVWAQGIHGGGARAGSAVPGGLTGRMADFASAQGVLRFGVPLL